MKHIKRLGLAAVAALALTATVGTAAASATEKFDSESYPAEFTAGGSTANISLGLNYIGFNCTVPAFRGEMSARTASLTPNAPSSSPCTVSTTETKTQLNWNGCTAIFHPGTYNSETKKYTGSWDIGPAGCGPMTIERPEYCVYSIGAQPGGPITYENIGAGATREVKFNNPTSEHLTYSTKRLKPQFLCPDGGVMENGSLTTTTEPWYLKTFNIGGKYQKGIWIKWFES